MTTKRTRQSRSASTANAADARFPIVGIGASAGGLEAFTQLLQHLPLDTGMAFVLVQHLDPEHESALAQILARATSLPVHEVTDKQRVEPNHVYVIPPGTNLGIDAGILKLKVRPKTRVPHHPIDAFFETLAQDRREAAIGVVLSGTASDGMLGLEAIKAEGGITFAQDDSAKYHSMPRSAIAAGCVDLVLSPARIAEELGQIAKHPFGAGQALESSLRAENDRAEATAHEDDRSALPSGGHGAPPTLARRARAEAARDRKPGTNDAAGAQDGYKKILLLLRNHSGVDFSLYKSPTIQRRVARRLVLNKLHTLEDYALFLRGNTKELDALYSDVLISVTSFFRNPEAFEILQREVLPKLMKQRSDEPLRCWVLGCSTGQEAYSIAMSFIEVVEKAAYTRKLQIFATDLNEALLEKARHGLYARSLAGDLSPQRLRRFFVEEEGGYRVTKALREMVVFARQNLIADPPFSRLDIISCRNLLIYLEPGLQKKALPTFHYALKPEGFLLLGASESIGEFTELFEPVDKKFKIYVKKPSQSPVFHLPVKRERTVIAAGQPALPMRFTTAQDAPESLREELSAQREADRITINQFAPPAVLVNAELQIMQFRGPTGAYLQPAAGKASFDVLKMAREGLMLPLRAAINQAKTSNKTARKEGVRIKQNGKFRAVNLQVIPLKNLRERGFLILFDDAPKAARTEGKRQSEPVAAAVPARQETRRSAELEAELAEMREYQQSMQEQHEAASEELQAAHEEVQSANEELQSINEELETSKEELESANEELITVNEEMVSRNAELNRLNSDLVNLQISARLAVVLLDRDLTIRRFSPQAEKQFDLLATDLGRSIKHIRHHLVLASPTGDAAPVDLEGLSAEVIAAVREQDREVRDSGGRWYSLRVRPYLTLENKVDGAVMVLVDIDSLKRGEHAIAAARDYAENVIRTIREPLLVLDNKLHVDSANPAFYRTFGVKPASTVGQFVYDLGNRQWDIPRLRELLQEVLTHSTSIEEFEVEHDFEQLGRRVMLLNARRILDVEKRADRILLAIEDVTDRRKAEEEGRSREGQLRRDADSLVAADRRKNEFLAMLAHELRNPLAPISNGVRILRMKGAKGLADPGVLEIMERQVHHMVRLVDDLLDVNRIDQSKIQLRRERVELATIVNFAVEAVRPFMDRLDHTMTVVQPPEPILLDADPERLGQLLVNLLNNACKFTDRGGRIQLTVERAGKQAVIRVKDNGVGIAADQLPLIFDLFMQTNSALERPVSGLGIGLTLVKKLIEMHDGTVEAHSDGVGHGSEFTIRLPLAAQAPKLLPPIARSAPARTDVKCVLVVDDNHDAASTLAMLLQMSGMQTHIVNNGAEVLEAAERLRPDLVLLDIGMPKVNGYEAVRMIRSQPWGRSMRLVAVTGWGQEEHRRKSREAGFDGHLVKPVDPAALATLLADIRAVDQVGKD